MSEVWPFDVHKRLEGAPTEAIRPFKCLLLMPFGGRFDRIAEEIRQTVTTVVAAEFRMDLPHVQRLDWVDSRGTIQQQIWQEITEADLIFCDITGYNPNVMFECGVCAAWKAMKQVVFMRDRFFSQEWAFDLQPVRQLQYELVSEQLTRLRQEIAQITRDACIAFPDGQGACPKVPLPFEVTFAGARDDPRIYTPPLSQRRVVADSLEFGSARSYAHSWASVGKEKFDNVELDFTAHFSNIVYENSYMGVGLRSQHYYTGFEHLLYLDRRGRIVVAGPSDTPPFWYDSVVRPDTPIALDVDHHFHIRFSGSVLDFQVDEFRSLLDIATMGKVLGPGLIRLQSWMCWMVLKHIRVAGAGTA